MSAPESIWSIFIIYFHLWLQFKCITVKSLKRKCLKEGNLANLEVYCRQTVKLASGKTRHLIVETEPHSEEFAWCKSHQKYFVP